MSVLHNGRKYDLCGYSNCFREAIKMRGFMPICAVHLKTPQKWGKDGMTFTGTRFIKKGDE